MPISPEIRALMDRAGALFGSGRYLEAERTYRSAIGLAPDLAPAYSNLATVLLTLGRGDEAEPLLRRALELRPDYPEALNGLAASLRRRGALDEAAEACRRAIELRPDYVAALNNLANIEGDRRNYPEAERLYREALALAPGSLDALRNLGAILVDMGRYDEALVWQSRALSLDPDDVVAIGDVAISLSARGRAAEALDLIGKARARLPARAQLFHAEAVARFSLGEVDAAIERERQALRADPGIAEHHFALGLYLLTAGRREEGTAEFEWRLRVPRTRQALPPIPQWDGGTIGKRRLILVNSLGLGDAIQFGRYAPRLRERCAELVLAVSAPLVDLFAASFPECRCVDQAGVALGAGDVWYDLASLPWLFEWEEGATTGAYLKVPEEAAERWQDRVGPAGPLRVGLAWSGNPRHVMDWTRSIPLARLEPLLELPGVVFHAVQTGVGPADRGTYDRLVAGGKLVAHDAALTSFGETAGLCAALDLVISVDTALAHLAGALGCESWVLLAHTPEWRWSILGEGREWYPRLRQFRQPRSGDWDAVIAAVREELSVRRH